MRRGPRIIRRLACIACAATLGTLALLSGCASPRGLDRADDATLHDAAAGDAIALPVPPAAAPIGAERLGYAIALAGLPVGDATFETRVAGDTFELAVEGGTNALLELLYPVRGVARSRLAADGTSRSFFLAVDENGKSSERALTYRETPCLYYHPWNDQPWVAVLAQFRAPIDPLGLLTKLRRLDPDRATHDFEVAMTLRSFCYRARVTERRPVAVPAGDFADAWIWEVEVRPYLQLGAGDAAPEVGPILGFYEVAISADARRLPLEVRRSFGFGEVALKLTTIAPTESGDPSVATLVPAIGRPTVDE